MEKRTVEIKHSPPISYWVAGSEDAPPAVVDPGLLGRDISPAVEALGQDFRAHSFDPPGFWDSPPQDRPLTIPSLSGTVGEAQKKLFGNSVASALSFSFGAVPRIYLAHSNPGTVSKLVLFEPIISGRDLPWILKGIIHATRLPAATPSILYFARTLAGFVRGARKVPKDKRVRIVEGIRDGKSAARLAQSLLHWNKTEQQLKELDIPVLIVWGGSNEDAGFVPVERLKELKAPHISHLELPDVHHFIKAREMIQLVEATRDFLKPS